MAFEQAMKSMGKPKAKAKPAEPGEKRVKDEPAKGSNKPEPHGTVGGEHGDGPGDAMSSIHQHLTAMHGMTGNAHTHVEHHMGGHHTSHHISEHGEVSGPHEHGSTDEVKQGMDQNLGMGQPDPGNAEVGNEPQHSMSGF
jgi:hypothetical protein